MLFAENDSSRKLKRIAAGASIGTALALTLIKGIAAVATGSLSILSSMVDSLADVLASMITFVAVIYAEKPLTCEHRYGFGKAEAVSALAQAAFICGSACFIIYDAIYRLFHPTMIEKTTVGIGVMIISLIMTLGLIMVQKYIIRRIKSQAIEADNKHYVIDLAANITVLISIFIVHRWHILWIDVAAAVLIAIYLIFTAVKIARRALEEITDKEADIEIRKNIVNAVLQVDGVKGYHDLRSRFSGSILFVEIHLEFDGQLSLFITHDIADAAEQKIIDLYPTAQVIIHQDPFGISEQRLDNNIQQPCDL